MICSGGEIARAAVVELMFTNNRSEGSRKCVEFRFTGRFSPQVDQKQYIKIKSTFSEL